MPKAKSNYHLAQTHSDVELNFVKWPEPRGLSGGPECSDKKCSPPDQQATCRNHYSPFPAQAREVAGSDDGARRHGCEPQTPCPGIQDL